MKSETRKIIKEKKSIKKSDQNYNSCIDCYFHSSSRLCTKHYVITAQDEICNDYSNKSIKVYRGGSVSPR